MAQGKTPNRAACCPFGLVFSSPASHVVPYSMLLFRFGSRSRTRLHRDLLAVSSNWHRTTIFGRPFRSAVWAAPKPLHRLLPSSWQTPTPRIRTSKCTMASPWLHDGFELAATAQLRRPRREALGASAKFLIFCMAGGFV